MTCANKMKNKTDVWETIKNSMFYATHKNNDSEAAKFCVPIEVAKQNGSEYLSTNHGFVHHTKQCKYKRTIKNGNTQIQHCMDTNDQFLYDAMLYSMWNLEFQYESWHKKLVFVDLEITSSERNNYIFKIAVKDYMDYCVENNLI